MATFYPLAGGVTSCEAEGVPCDGQRGFSEEQEGCYPPYEALSNHVF